MIDKFKLEELLLKYKNNFNKIKEEKKVIIKIYKKLSFDINHSQEGYLINIIKEGKRDNNLPFVPDDFNISYTITEENGIYKVMIDSLYNNTKQNFSELSEIEYNRLTLLILEICELENKYNNEQLINIIKEL